VAVAGMEDVGDAQAILRRELLDAAQDLGQALARDRAVHAEVVGRDAPDRRERGLAPRPERQQTLLAGADSAMRGTVPARDRLDRGDQLVDLLRRAVELDDQQRVD